MMKMISIEKSELLQPCTSMEYSVQNTILIVRDNCSSLGIDMGTDRRALKLLEVMRHATRGSVALDVHMDWILHGTVCRYYL